MSPLGLSANLSVCGMSASPFTDEKTSPGRLFMIKLQCTSQFTVSSYHDSTIWTFTWAGKSHNGSNKAEGVKLKSPDPA